MLCLGAGYVARALSARLNEGGWRVAGTARNEATAAALKPLGIEPIAWSETAIADALAEAGAILVSTPPAGGVCPGAAILARAIVGKPRPRWIGYLSSTAVYGDYCGDWVDEASPPRSPAPRGLARLAAEAAWRTLGDRMGAPVIVFRLAGIYGPGRSAIDAVREGSARRIVKQGHVLNRIHVDDIVDALVASLHSPGAADVFNLADDEPAATADVVDEACRLLGVAPPPLERYEDAAMSEMARGFFLEGKRVRNDRVKAALGLRLRHPTYREGLRAILAGDHS